MALSDKFGLEMPKRDWISEAIGSLPALVTAKEATAVLRCSRRTLAREIARGRIDAVRQGDGCAKVLVPRAELARYLEGLSR